MGALMKEMPFNGAQIFRPLPLDVDQRPLAAAEGEMLQSGKGGFVCLPVWGDYPICSQVTPCGSASSCTSMV